MIISEFISALSGGRFDDILREIYGDSENEILSQRVRLVDSCEHFAGKYPECSDVSIFSVPAVTEINGISFILSADRITTKAGRFRYVSDNIPKGFRTFSNETAVYIPECFSGYSLCISGTKKSHEIPLIPDVENFCGSIPELRKEHSDRDILRMAVYNDCQARRTLQLDALGRGDAAEFFRLLNDSPMPFICSDKVQTAVIAGREFLSGDGAVTAENGIVSAFVPSYLAQEYTGIMSDIFGAGKCIVTQVRYTGGIEITS